ncbi:MAG: potassium channel family protein [Elusimicrobiota bacterium]
MHIIIAGGGSLGTALVEKLTLSKNDVVVVDESKEACDELYASFGIETIMGNATRINVLKEAGLDKTDAVISTIRKDDVNLAITSLAKSSAVPEIIILMRRKSYFEAYRTTGATRILNMADRLVDDVMQQIEKPAVRRVARLGNGAVEVFLINIPQDAKIAGKSVSKIASSKKMPVESIIAGIFDKDTKEYKIPRGDTRIEGDSNIFVITKPEKVNETAAYLMK